MTQELAQQLLLGTKEGYNLIAKDFSDSRARLWEDITRFKEFVVDGNCLLDLGCGNGRLYELFQDKKISYVGLDSSQELVKLAQVKWQKEIQEKKDVGFIAGDILDLPFKDSQFDIVFLVAVLNHIPSRELRMQALRNVYKVLKPGGMLLMTNWNLWRLASTKSFWRYKMPINFITDLKDGLGLKDILTYWKGRAGEAELYYYAFTLREIDNLVKDAGFQNTDCYYSRKGERTNWLKGDNLVMIARK